jgi:hypothetical protein
VHGAHRRTPRRDNQTTRSSGLWKLPAEGMCGCGCAAVVAGGRLPPPNLRRPLHRRRRGTSVRAEASPGGESQRKKVAVAGAGWAGLAAAHHLVKQVSPRAQNTCANFTSSWIRVHGNVIIWFTAAKIVLMIRDMMSCFSGRRAARRRGLVSEVLQPPGRGSREMFLSRCQFQ